MVPGSTSLLEACLGAARTQAQRRAEVRTGHVSFQGVRPHCTPGWKRKVESRSGRIPVWLGASAKSQRAGREKAFFRSFSVMVPLVEVLPHVGLKEADL